MPDQITVTAPYGGGAGTVTPFVAPSLGLSYSEAIDAAGFGNDRATGAPVRVTFAVPMNSVALQFLYQDPNEDGRGNASGVRLSAGQVTARFYDATGALIGETSGLTDGANGAILAGNFEGNNPQGAVRVTAPIAVAEISMPQSFGSETWLAGAVPAGRVDYASLAADAAAKNYRTELAVQQLNETATVGQQAMADATRFVQAAAFAAKANWQDGQLNDGAAGVQVQYTASRAMFDAALEASDVNESFIGYTDKQAHEQVAAARAFFATYVAPTLPASLAPRVQFFQDLYDSRFPAYVPITTLQPRPGAIPITGTTTPTDTVGIGPATNPTAQNVANGVPPGGTSALNPLGSSPTIDELPAPGSTVPGTATEPPAKPAGLTLTGSTILVVVLAAIIFALLLRS